MFASASASASRRIIISIATTKRRRSKKKEKGAKQETNKGRARSHNIGGRRAHARLTPTTRRTDAMRPTDEDPYHFKQGFKRMTSATHASNKGIIDENLPPRIIGSAEERGILFFSK
jgi:hypothetical protein